LVVENIGDILSVSKLESQNFDMKRLNFKTLKNVEVREQ